MYEVMSNFRNGGKNYDKGSIIDGKGVSDLKFLLTKGLVKEVKKPELSKPKEVKPEKQLPSKAKAGKPSKGE